MLLGLLSDSHDNLPTLRAGIALLRARGARVLLHLGDICDPNVLDEFAGLPEDGIAVHFVFGNNDYDHAALRARAAHHGLTCHQHAGELLLADRRLALTHGDDHALMRQWLETQRLDYLFHGHTHRVADRREGKTRIINPGALHRATPKTVALLDLATDTLDLLSVSPAPRPPL